MIYRFYLFELVCPDCGEYSQAARDKRYLGDLACKLCGTQLKIISVTVQPPGSTPKG